MLNIYKRAANDMKDGLRLSAVWMALAKEDIGDQHRNTTLGPLWLVVNYLAFAASFIFLVRVGRDDPNYPAFVATGLLVWFYMMDVITNSVTLFLREENFIKGTTLPISVYVFRFFAQSVIRGGYALVGCIFILAVSGSAPTMVWLYSIFGIAILVMTAPAVIIIFAFVGALFPDSQFLITNLMRVGMFLTPVFWTYEGTGGIRHFFYYWNPFTYFLEIVRFPIVYNMVPVTPSLIAIGIGCGLWISALWLLGRLCRRIVFYL